MAVPFESSPDTRATGPAVERYPLHIGGVHFEVISAPGWCPFLKAPHFRNFFLHNGDRDVAWLINELPCDEEEVPPSLPLEEVFRRAATMGSPVAGHQPLWRSRAVQLNLGHRWSHLDDCTFDLRSYRIILWDFIQRELVTFYPHRMKETMRTLRMDPSIIAPFFPLFSGFMTHSSAAIRNGKAVVFLAPDEGGKTTAVRSAPSATVLSDDQNVIRREEDGSFFVYSTPWSLFQNGSRKAPLGIFFLLKKGCTFQLSPLRPRDLARYLWGEHLSDISKMPKSLRLTAFHLLCDFSEATPAFTMQLPKGYVDWDAVDRAMNGG